MLQIHPNARTTPVTRAEIARSSNQAALSRCAMGSALRLFANGASGARPSAKIAPPVLTVCPGRRRKRSGPLSAPLRQSTNFPLDDLTFVMTHFLPHLNRDSIWRILRAKASVDGGRPSPLSRLADRASAGIMTSASFISISSICPSCRRLTANGASATSMPLSTAAPGLCT